MPLMPMPPIPTKWMGPISRGNPWVPRAVIARQSGRASIPRHFRTGRGGLLDAPLSKALTRPFCVIPGAGSDEPHQRAAAAR